MVKHGEAINGKRTRLYNCWVSMKLRAKSRGDCKVHPPWLDYSVFKAWAISNGYQDGLCLCREGDKGDYAPDNVRWDTQANNARESAMIWEVTHPDGTTEIVKSLRPFCKKHKLDNSKMSAVAHGRDGRKQHKGFKCKCLGRDNT